MTDGGETAAARLGRAVALHQQGRLEEAAALYAQVLAQEPGNAGALHLSGVAARQSGRAAEAVLRIANAANRDPTLPGLHHNLALAVASLGPPDAVAAELVRRLGAAPDDHALRLLLLHTLAQTVTGTDVPPAPPVTAPPVTAMAGASVSVVVCSIDPAKFAAVSANLTAVLAGCEHEIIGIHDARSLCEGYAHGLARSRGDILVFCHDDIKILTPDFAARLRAHLERFDIVGPVGTTRMAGASWLYSGWPHQHGIVVHAARGPNPFRVEVYGAPAAAVPGAQALDGLFLAGRRAAVEAVGFDAATFDGFHLYDMDFTFRAHRAGLRVAACPDLWMVHRSTGRMDTVWRRYADRFIERHAGALAPQAAQGPNPLRAVWLATPGAVRAFCARVLSIGAPAFGLLPAGAS
ncbi:glycosyltransferase [Azospirillum sp. TSO22-1]|uniref:glycosyltransferase n=1 Tax=Azospirillum sp. TSO22-1 TaxID=716789 RepID=UPI000D621D83|nr:glycosyltransferase [Azospirillum sp. TSO22-1]PWC35730.1 hypothetical protein TSO221_29085 [Azospirillum sp. TSO22-1]